MLFLAASSASAAVRAAIEEKMERWAYLEELAAKIAEQ